MPNEYANAVVKETIKRFRELRIKQKLSHDALARQVGVTRPAISHLEAGKRKPSLRLSLKIAAALGVELSDLLREIEDLAKIH